MIGDEELTRRLDVATAAARAGGQRLRELFETDLQVDTKSSYADLVTRADREAEAIVVQCLRDALPTDAIVAEESGEVVAGPGPRWYVDPLDGTTNYAHRFPHFSVSIGWFDGDEGLVGVVYEPNRDELFAAHRGGGAWLLRAGGRRTRLCTTQTTALADSLLATGFGYDRAAGANVEEFARVVRRVRGIRRAGSAALDLAYVAAGRVDGFWEYGLQPWDWGAGAVLVREAGGHVQAIDGGAWSLHGPSVCATGPGLVRALPEALSSSS